MRISRTLAAAAATAAVLTIGSPADATAGDQGARAGTVTLYGASPTAPVWRTAYAACTGQQAYVGHDVESFDNRPATGCQVVLVEGGWTFELCAGRGVVPAAFQTSPVLRIEPGSSPTCPVA